MRKFQSSFYEGSQLDNFFFYIGSQYSVLEVSTDVFADWYGCIDRN